MVIVRGGTGEQRALTGPDGRFEIASAEGATLVVRAGGFAERPVPIEAGEMTVVLEPATLFESVTVTSSRTEQRLGDVPDSVSVIDKETIRRSPAVVARGAICH